MPKRFITVPLILIEVRITKPQQCEPLKNSNQQAERYRHNWLSKVGVQADFCIALPQRIFSKT